MIATYTVSEPQPRPPITVTFTLTLSIAETEALLLLSNKQHFPCPTTIGGWPAPVTDVVEGFQDKLFNVVNNAVVQMSWRRYADNNLP